MQLYTNLTALDVQEIADNMGIELYELRNEGIRQRGPNKGKLALRFTLRPLSDKWRLIRDDPYTKSGERKVWAVSWGGHYVFMERLFKLDPYALLITSLARYEGQEGFIENAPATAYRNIGSQAHPQNYWEAV